MKVLHYFIISLFYLAVIFPQNLDTTISELRGLEDTSAYTHLFYRLNYSIKTSDYTLESNDVYHFNLKDYSEKDIISSTVTDRFNEGITFGQFVSDYEFWDNDPLKYISCGTIPGVEGAAFIKRFDGSSRINNLDWTINGLNLAISKQNDSLLFASVSQLVKSTDGGWNWYPTDSSEKYVLASLNPYDDKMLFVTDFDGKMWKSSDTAKSFIMVDTNLSYWAPKFFYDPDSLYIYRISNAFGYDYLSVSSSRGDAGTWSLKYPNSNSLYLTVDYSKSGTIYLADSNNILISTDYGNTFTIFKTLNATIVGIYKKPGSDKLYAATKYDIFEISSSSIRSIKHINPFQAVLDYYPLKVGNVWIYAGESHCVTLGTPSGMVHTRKVINQVKKDNNNIYFEIEEDYYYQNNQNYYYERIDTNSGKVFRYNADSVRTGNEYLIDNLNASNGDTVFSARFEPSYRPYYITDEHDTTILQKNIRIKTYFTDGLEPWSYKLAKGFGLVYESIGDDFRCFSCTLQGAVIDGIVYGDTTLTSVSNGKNVQSSFTLFQNYPNPFNPSTTITYEIPKSGLVQLKIYDILGREIAMLVNENQSAGKHSIAFNPLQTKKQLSSGIYFYRLKFGSNVLNKKMILLR